MAESGQQVPSARAFHESVLINDRTFVWGGFNWNEDGDGHQSHVDVFSVNMLNGEWHKHTVTPTDAPTPCIDACSAAIGNTIYSFGGWSRRGSNELLKLDLVEMSWKKVGENGIKPERRRGAGMCQVNEKLLLMGGFGSFTNKKHPHAQYKESRYEKGVGWNNEFFEFEPHTDCWSALLVTGSQPSPRQHHTLTAVDDKRAVLFGGYDGDMFFNDLWLFDYGKKEWTEIRPSSSLWPQPRSLHTVCTMVCDNQEIKLLLMGGCGINRRTLDDCWLLDVHQGIGEKVMFDGGPFLSRNCHSAQCVKLSDTTVVVSVFGGLDKSSRVLGSPCFYHWNPHNPNMLHYGLAPAGTTLHPSESGQQVPSARAFHESVLVNDRTFVWGGWKEDVGYHSHVDVFSVNMLNGEWHKHTQQQLNSVTPTDAPKPCGDACSAAIGNTIYSFGGWSDRGYSDELFKLDLGEMSWKKVGEKGMKPERRKGAGMCQVNEKLLLMGGSGPFTNKKHPHAQYKEFNKMVGWNNEFFEFEPHTGECMWSIICSHFLHNPMKCVVVWDMSVN